MTKYEIKATNIKANDVMSVIRNITKCNAKTIEFTMKMHNGDKYSFVLKDSDGNPGIFLNNVKLENE